MATSIKKQFGISLTGLRLLPYAALGILIFSFNSYTNLNYFWRGYLVLLEFQAGAVVLYFLLAKLSKIRHSQIRDRPSNSTILPEFKRY